MTDPAHAFAFSAFAIDSAAFAIDSLSRVIGWIIIYTNHAATSRTGGASNAFAIARVLAKHTRDISTVRCAN